MGDSSPPLRDGRPWARRRAAPPPSPRQRRVRTSRHTPSTERRAPGRAASRSPLGRRDGAEHPHCGVPRRDISSRNGPSPTHTSSRSLVRSADQATSRTFPPPCPARDGPRTGRSATRRGSAGRGLPTKCGFTLTRAAGRPPATSRSRTNAVGARNSATPRPCSSAPVVDEGRRRGSRGEHRVVVAAMLDAGPGRPPQAVLTGAAVAEEVACQGTPAGSCAPS